MISESLVEDENKVPDGGWGWVIVFGATMTHFLLVGIARCLGVIYLCLRERYQSSAANTAWVASAFNTSRTLTAPLASMLCERFGCRVVAYVGGLIFSVGLMISAFSTSLLFMLFSFGLLSGFGGVLVFTPAYIIVGEYFDKRKGTAMGLATIGSGLGSLIFVPEFAVEKGFSHSEAALLLSVYGFTDLTIRFLCAFLFDLRGVRKERRYPFALVGIMFGISTIVISLMPDYGTLAIAMTFNALFESAFDSQRATVISEFVTRKQMSMAVGMMIASQGIGNITGPPLAGTNISSNPTINYSGNYDN
ncbi:hypothetical protein CAPTEDRAFT_136933 [Capitella teleta]|uniref:Major facilitator superfamily (MFS) profile domain-containing protein n=1 Tax=Capitella teleta TaxID=283909 RepID=R7U275_CAPTE|nr:hypothetical protein CAPTEDRAFT_136933 [Capitella teleta]|eukprot:ELT99982.1 hypothetical protein CAPTEDRAFT_136933 [Capitella teleta]